MAPDSISPETEAWIEQIARRVADQVLQHNESRLRELARKVALELFDNGLLKAHTNGCPHGKRLAALYYTGRGIRIALMAVVGALGGALGVIGTMLVLL